MSSLSAPTRRLTVTRHASEEAWWELFSADIDPRLRGYVVSWCGSREWTADRSRRREVPGGIVPFIIDFGAYGVASPESSPQFTRHAHGFVAGMHESFALTESIGPATAIQVNLTPLGAYLLLGRPMSDLTNRVVAIDDLLGASGVQLADQLEDVADWDRRFDLMEAFILKRLAIAREPARGVVWAWQQLARTAGQIAIGDLAAELGCSRRHLIAQFHEQIGVSPKTAARILRFERAVRLCQRRTDLSGTDVALACGYFDQAHFIRDFRQFAGLTPTEFLRRQIPDLDATSAD